MTYFHRGNFRHFNLTPLVIPAKREPKIAAEIDADFPIQREPAEIGDGKTEKLVG